MSKKKPSVESLKMGFTLFFIIGLLLCFWMDNSVSAFVVLLVGAVMGGMARDVKYAEQRKPLVVDVPDELKCSDAEMDFYEAIETHKHLNPRNR